MSIGNQNELEFGDNTEENEAAEREFFEKMRNIYTNVKSFYDEHKQGCGNKSSFQDVMGNILTVPGAVFSDGYEYFCSIIKQNPALKNASIERITYLEKYIELLKDTDILAKERNNTDGAFPELRKEAEQKRHEYNRPAHLIYVDLVWERVYGNKS